MKSRRRRQAAALGSMSALITAPVVAFQPTAANAATLSGIIMVDLNASNPRNSLMTLADGLNVEDQFRTGSGDGSTDTCYTNHGPLPTGTYDIAPSPYHSDSYSGSAIFGRVWRVNDMRCPDGTLRTELFIHTEETPSRGQGSAENQRWDGTSDYASQGCLKVARSENGGDNGVGRLDIWFHSKGTGGTTGTRYDGAVVVYW